MCIRDSTDTYEVPYEYYILTVTLKNRTLPVVINDRLTADQKELYSATIWTKGNKPYLWDNIYTCLLYTSRCV